MDLDKEQQRGHRAKQILEDEIFVEAIQKVSAELDQEWINSPVRGTDRKSTRLTPVTSRSRMPSSA